MNGPNKITIGRANIRSNGDVVFCWVENSVECEAIRKDIQYIRKDNMLEWLEMLKDNVVGDEKRILVLSIMDKINSL